MKNKLKKLFTLLLAVLMTISCGAIFSSAASVARVTSLQAYNIDDDEINLKWKKVSGADGYTVYMYTSNGWKSQGSTKKTNFEVDDLVSAKQYKFKVRAYDLVKGKKVYGSYSYVLTVSTDPDEVENLKVTKKTSASVTLTWSKVKRATKYQVYMYDSSKGKYVCVATVSGVKATIKDLKAGTTYKFKVRAYYKPSKLVYYGEFSDVLSVKTSKKATTSSSVSTTLIGASKAGQIALDHAKLTKSQVREYECQLDREDGIQVYEIEFSYGKYEYEYEINAKTGKILYAEKSRD